MTRTILLIIALLVICFLLWMVTDKNHTIIQKNEEIMQAINGDSSRYKRAVAVVISAIRRADKADSTLKSHDLLRADEKAFEARIQFKYQTEIMRLRKKLAAVNTSRASVPELDSIQRSMFGAPPDDSLHTIPLDYSRKLTGDAMRLPIEQRIATRAEERLDSAKRHAGRQFASYELDIYDLKLRSDSQLASLDSMLTIVKGMQGDITKARRKADRNIVISIGAGATADTKGLHYGPQITIGYKIAGFRIGKRK